MRIALLGSGIEAMELARAVQRDADHQLSAVAEAAGTPEIGETPVVTWEAMLNPDVAEAIIVGRTDEPDRRADQLRQLVQASVPMILIHPACEAIVGYELDMIRRDTECVMVPYFTGHAHPVYDWLRQLVRQAPEAPIGKVEQLVFERQMAERGRESVLRQLARDALLIRQILGNVTRLTAVGPNYGQSTDYGNLSVHLSGPQEVLARWSVSSTDQPPEARICLAGQTERATVELDEHGGVRAWHIPGVSPSDEPVLSWDGPASAIGFLANSGRGEKTNPPGMTPAEQQTWPIRLTSVCGEDAQSTFTRNLVRKRIPSRESWRSAAVVPCS